MATLVATLAGSTSNSYITLETADQIADNLPGGDDWLELTEEERNLSLITATRWLDTLNYAGERCEDNQRLKWPRKDATCDGVTSDCEGIPYRIQEAETKLAILYTTEPGKFPGGGGSGAAAGTYVKRQKLGSLEIEYDQYSGTSVTSCDNCNDPAIITSFPWLRDLLGCWLGGITGGVGLMLRVRS